MSILIKIRASHFCFKSLQNVLPQSLPLQVHYHKHDFCLFLQTKCIISIIMSLRLVLNLEHSIKFPLSLFQGSFDCNGLYQWLPLRGVQSEPGMGGETHALVNREHFWRRDVLLGRTPRAAAVPPDSALEFPPFLFLYSLLTSLFVFLIPYFFPDVSDSFMICCRLSSERKK